MASLLVSSRRNKDCRRIVNELPRGTEDAGGEPNQRQEEANKPMHNTPGVERTKYPRYDYNCHRQQLSFLCAYDAAFLFSIRESHLTVNY